MSRYNPIYDRGLNRDLEVVHANTKDRLMGNEIWTKDNQYVELSKEDVEEEDEEECPMGIMEGKKRQRLVRSGHIVNSPMEQT